MLTPISILLERQYKKRNVNFSSCLDSSFRFPHGSISIRTPLSLIGVSLGYSRLKERLFNEVQL